MNCEEEIVAELIDKAHSDNTSILKYNDENSLSCVISLAYYSARKTYTTERELPAGKGYADLVFRPRKNNILIALKITLVKFCLLGLIMIGMINNILARLKKSLSKTKFYLKRA